MPRPKPIPLSAPDITREETRAVARVLASGRLSLGPELEAFEREMAAFAGVRHAVGVSSGTSGLHLCVRALRIGGGDEVITTPLSFVASANAIAYERAKPVFVDVDPVTLNIDAEKIEGAVTRSTRAILVVHLFGRPAPMDRVLAIAERRGLAVIEDACEALGGEWRGRRLGSLGDAGVFAFYPNKQITTAEGGMIVTRRAGIARFAASLRNQGRADGGRGETFAELGYNYRLSDVHSAIGRAQLRRLEKILRRRAAIARAYNDRLSGHPGLVLPALSFPDGRQSWFVYIVRLAAPLGSSARDGLMRDLQKSGIGCGRYFPPIHLHPHYRRLLGHRRGDFPVAEAAAGRTLALPFFNRISKAEIERVCRTLRGRLDVHLGTATD